MDESKENTLYKNYINAQYEYFKYIEPIRVAKIASKINGKVKDPGHWRTIMENRELEKQKAAKESEENPSASKNDCKQYKELLLMFHPDKNPHNLEDATRYFQFLIKMIEENNTDFLDELMKSDDKWSMMKELYSDDSIYMKAKYCNTAMMCRWFTWNSDDDRQFLTQEELEEKLKCECDKLEKEVQQLRDLCKLSGIDTSKVQKN